MAKRIDISQAPAWLASMGSGVKVAAMRGLYSAAIRTVQHIQTSVIPAEPRVPVDRGIYRAGWRAEHIPEGALVVNRVPHAIFIEYGVRAANVKPGRAMIDALAEWVRRKGIEKSGTGARQVAFAIAMSMKKKGIFNGGNGLRILEKAARRIPRFISEEIGREIEKV